MSAIDELRIQIEHLDKLPPLPMVAKEILELQGQTQPNISKLAKAIELDPSLSAQVIRYASSSLYGYRGHIDSADTAIARVLGYDVVFNLALGLAVSKPFDIPRQGPLGLEAYWSHAVYSAILCQKLATALPATQRPPLGLAYLAGLLHNIGLLVLGQLFPGDYALLNSFISANPEKNLIETEEEVFGENHQRIGAWLLHKWQLPEELVVACCTHHDADYRGVHQTYSRLTHLSDCLLHQGDTDAGKLNVSPKVLSDLDLDAATVEKIAAEVRLKAKDLEKTILQFVA